MVEKSHLLFLILPGNTRRPMYRFCGSAAYGRGLRVIPYQEKKKFTLGTCTRLQRFPRFQRQPSRLNA
jgi:hypothetical protein